MLKHIVMWKLKDEVDGLDKSECAVIIKEKLESLKSEIPEIKKIEVGVGVGMPGSTYDAVLYTEFDSQADLDVYQGHPKHLEAAGFVRKAAAERSAVDYPV